MEKYVKVMFGTSSGANSDLKYKIDDVNISNIWNPKSDDPKEMGGFNFSTESKVFRWLVRGDTIYDVIIPDDAEVINCESEAAPNGVFRTNKIIITNPRIVTDELALELYKKSDLPEKSYYKAMAGCAVRGYEKTVYTIINDRVNKDNIEDVLSEVIDFIGKDNIKEIEKDSLIIKMLDSLNKIKES